MWELSPFKYESFNHDRSDWKTFSVLLKPGQRLIKNVKLVGGRSFPLKENWYFTGCNAVKFLLVGCLVEVADKKELLGLLCDFFGRTLHASWKQKSCFVMFAPWLNDWVNERPFQTVYFAWKSCIVLELVCCLSGCHLFSSIAPMQNKYFCTRNSYRNDKT